MLTLEGIWSTKHTAANGGNTIIKVRSIKKTNEQKKSGTRESRDNVIAAVLTKFVKNM